MFSAKQREKDNTNHSDGSMSTPTKLRQLKQHTPSSDEQVRSSNEETFHRLNERTESSGSDVAPSSRMRTSTMKDNANYLNKNNLDINLVLSNSKINGKNEKDKSSKRKSNLNRALNEESTPSVGKLFRNFTQNYTLDIILYSVL